MLNKLDKMLDQQIKEMRGGSKDIHRRFSRDSRDSRDKEIVEIVGTIETAGAVEEVIGVIQTQVQKMIDIGLEVGIVLEVDLEVEEGLSRTVLTATNQIMIGLIVIDIPKT